VKEHEDYFSMLEKHACVLCYWLPACRGKEFVKCDNLFKPIGFGEYVNRVEKAKNE